MRNSSRRVLLVLSLALGTDALLPPPALAQATISPRALAARMVDGDATVATDTGHLVEQGVAPETVVARKRENDSDSASKVLGTGPICAWPRVPRHPGRRSAGAAASFECRLPG